MTSYKLTESQYNFLCTLHLQMIEKQETSSEFTYFATRIGNIIKNAEQIKTETYLPAPKFHVGDRIVYEPNYPNGGLVFTIERVSYDTDINAWEYDFDCPDHAHENWMRTHRAESELEHFVKLT